MEVYAPLAHALGFGAAFEDLEALSYETLFSESLWRLKLWYQQIPVAITRY